MISLTSSLLLVFFGISFFSHVTAAPLPGLCHSRDTGAISPQPLSAPRPTVATSVPPSQPRRIGVDTSPQLPLSIAFIDPWATPSAPSASAVGEQVHRAGRGRNSNLPRLATLPEGQMLHMPRVIYQTLDGVEIPQNQIPDSLYLESDDQSSESVSPSSRRNSNVQQELDQRQLDYGFQGGDSPDINSATQFMTDYLRIQLIQPPVTIPRPLKTNLRDLRPGPGPR